MKYLKIIAFATLKILLLIGLLAGVWVYSGEYHRKLHREDLDEVVQVRVRHECLRPGWIHTTIQAKEYDLSVQEIDLLTDKVTTVRRQVQELEAYRDRVEEFKAEVLEAPKGEAPKGVGGPGGRKR